MAGALRLRWPMVPPIPILIPILISPPLTTRPSCPCRLGPQTPLFFSCWSQASGRMLYDMEPKIPSLPLTLTFLISSSVVCKRHRLAQFPLFPAIRRAFLVMPLVSVLSSNCGAGFFPRPWESSPLPVYGGWWWPPLPARQRLDPFGTHPQNPSYPRPPTATGTGP